jgi:hypothetical protein
MVPFEFYKIYNGNIPDYNYLEHLGIYVDSKKNDVFNQNLIRPTGLMLDPNYTAAYSGIGAIVFDYLRRKKSKFYIVPCIICVIPSVLTMSRTGLFSIFLCFLFSAYCVFLLKKRDAYIAFPQTIMFSILVAASVFIYLNTIDDNFVEGQLNRLMMKDSSAGTRTQYIDYFLQHASFLQLLFGCGTCASGLFLTPNSGIWAPESNYITYLVEFGLVYIVLYALFFVYILRRLLKINFYYSLIYLYINIIGISYNFLADRLFYFLTCIFVMYSFDMRCNAQVTGKSASIPMNDKRCNI